MKQYETHPNWRLAFHVLTGLLPDARGFDPDDLPVDAWQPFPTEGRADHDIADDLWARVGRPSGLLLIVTFASYLRNAGPFFVRSDDLDHMVESHAATFDDPFFSTDVCIVDAESRRVVVVHHEGYVGVFQAR